MRTHLTSSSYFTEFYYYFIVKPRLADTRLIRTPHYYGQFALSLVRESPYIFYKFKPLNTDTLWPPQCPY